MPWISELERTGRVSRIDLARLDADETAAMLASITGEAPSADGRVALPPPLGRQPVLHRGAGAGRDRPGERPTPVDAAGDPRHAARGAVRARPRRRGHRGRRRVAASITTSSPRPPIAWTSRISTPLSVMRSRARSWSSTPTPPKLRATRSATPCWPRWPTTTCSPASAGGSTGRVPRRWRARPTPTGAPAAAHWAELAHHWAHAHEPVKAFEASLEAAAAAEATYAFEASLHQYERVIELWTSVPDPEGLAGADQAEILLRAAQMAHSRRPRRSVRRASARGDRRRRSRRGPVRLAVMHQALGRALWANGDSAEALVEYERRSRRCPPSRRPPSAQACCRATGRC